MSTPDYTIKRGGKLGFQMKIGTDPHRSVDCDDLRAALNMLATFVALSPVPSERTIDVRIKL